MIPPLDPADSETEIMLQNLEREIKRRYKKAADDLVDKCEDYFRRFKIKDDLKRKAVQKGILKQADYIKWRSQQIFVLTRWQAMVDALAEDLQHTREIALSTAFRYCEDAYAVNFNFATYAIDQQLSINPTFTLYNRQTVERLIRDNPRLLPLPVPGGETARILAQNKALRWSKEKISSAITQGVLQGESIPKIARRLESVAQIEHKSAIRNARTMMTSAQNAGRIGAAKRAEEMGVGVWNVWMATLDMRTRHEHRILDGQRRAVGEPFEVEGEKIRYPGDPEAKGYLVYNCRCTLIPQVKGFEYDIRSGNRMDFSKINGMSYSQWKASHREIPNPILLPEQKAAAIRGSYVAAYKRLRKKVNGT